MLVQYMKASGVAQPKPDSKKKFVASLCIMAAYNEGIELKAFIVRLSESKLYKELNDIVPKPGEKMLKGQGRHTLTSVTKSDQPASKKQRLAEFLMYLFHQAFGCGVKDGTYPIKVFDQTLSTRQAQTGGSALAFTGVEVRSQPLTTALASALA